MSTSQLNSAIYISFDISDLAVETTKKEGETRNEYFQQPNTASACKFKMRIAIPWKKLTKDSSGKQYAVQNTSSEFHSNLVCVCEIPYACPDTSLQSAHWGIYGNPVQSGFIFYINEANFHFYDTPCLPHHPQFFPAGPVRLANHSQWNRDHWATVSLHSLWLADIHCLDNTYRGGWTMTSCGETHICTPRSSTADVGALPWTLLGFQNMERPAVRARY